MMYVCSKKHGEIDAKMHILWKMKLLLHELLMNKGIINTPSQELYVTIVDGSSNSWHKMLIALFATFSMLCSYILQLII